VKTIAITEGKFKNRIKRDQIRLIKFTRRKQFRIKHNEFRKKIWFGTSKLRKYYGLISIKMKVQSGIEHIAQMRYISGLFAVNQNTIFINTIDYAEKFMKLQVSEEDLREGNLDITPNILFTSGSSFQNQYECLWHG
jgi:hypothetical protein